MHLFLRYACFFLFIYFISCSTEEKKTVPVQDKVFDVSIKSLDGKIVPVNDLIKGHRAGVIYFLMPGCPMCEMYSLSINQLEKKFSGKGISFHAVFASDYYSDEEVRSYGTDFKVKIPFYRDIDFKLTRKLGATVTPEVFVLDSTAALLYSGSIDNWAFGPGKIRMEATEFFLNDALENIVNGKPVAVKSTKAYGCIIE